jgi:hypothetical protein
MLDIRVPTRAATVRQRPRLRAFACLTVLLVGGASHASMPRHDVPRQPFVDRVALPE